MFWRKDAEPISCEAEDLLWPAPDSVNEAKHAVAFPVLLFQRDFAYMAPNARSLTTESSIRLLKDYAGILVIDSEGFSARIKEAEAVGPSQPRRWFAVARVPLRVRLIFDGQPVALSVDDMKAQLYRSFDTWDGWRHAVGTPGFEIMLKSVRSAQTIQEIMAILERTYRAAPESL